MSLLGNRGDDRADEYFELYSYPARVYLVLHSPALSNSQLKTAVVAGILPFNIVKGIIITIVFTFIFTKLKPWIEQNAASKHNKGLKRPLCEEQPGAFCLC